MFLLFSLQSIMNPASLMQSQGQHMPRQRQHIQGALSNIRAFRQTLPSCTFSIISTPDGNLVIRTSDDLIYHVEECWAQIEYNELTGVNAHMEVIDVNRHPNLFQELLRLRRYIDECEFISTDHGMRLAISFHDEESKSFLEFRNVIRVYFVLRR
jgi:hypothetical protein